MPNDEIPPPHLQVASVEDCDEITGEIIPDSAKFANSSDFVAFEPKVDGGARSKSRKKKPEASFEQYGQLERRGRGPWSPSQPAPGKPAERDRDRGWTSDESEELVIKLPRQHIPSSKGPETQPGPDSPAFYGIPRDGALIKSPAPSQPPRQHNGSSYVLASPGATFHPPGATFHHAGAPNTAADSYPHQAVPRRNGLHEHLSGQPSPRTRAVVENSARASASYRKDERSWSSSSSSYMNKSQNPSTIDSYGNRSTGGESIHSGYHSAQGGLPAGRGNARLTLENLRGLSLEGSDTRVKKSSSSGRNERAAHLQQGLGNSSPHQSANMKREVPRTMIDSLKDRLDGKPVGVPAQRQAYYGPMPPSPSYPSNVPVGAYPPSPFPGPYNAYSFPGWAPYPQMVGPPEPRSTRYQKSTAPGVGTAIDVKDPPLIQRTQLNNQPQSPGPGQELSLGRKGASSILSDPPPTSRHSSQLHYRMAARNSVISSLKGSGEDAGSRASDDAESSGADSTRLASDYPADSPTLDEGHPFLKVKDIVLGAVLQGFRSWQRGKACAAKPQEMGPPPQQGPSQSRSPRKPQRNSRSGDVHETAEDAFLASRKVSARHRRGLEQKGTFACPFSKKDPMRYRDCYKHILTRIRDVRQHIVRCHQVPSYCSRCMATFPSEETRDVHIRAVNCPERPFIKPEGVTESQRVQLSRKSPSNLSQEGRWFAVFDILFPKHSPRPQSPYIDNELSRDIALYQDFVTTQGPQILSEFLTLRGAVTWNLPNEERDLATFQNIILEEGLRIVFQQWASQNGLALATSISPTSLQSGFSTEYPPSSQGMVDLDPSRRVVTLDEHGEIEGDAFPTQQAAAQGHSDLVHLSAGLDMLHDAGQENGDVFPITLSEGQRSELMRMMFTGDSRETLSEVGWQNLP